MNANRRADLQRKLAVAPVPKPPAGLAAKIKGDIPKELRFNAERERARFAQSMRLSLAVAASVIVVIASAYLALQVADNNDKQPAETRPAAAKTPVLQLPAAVPPPPAAVAPLAAPVAKVVHATRRAKAKNQVEAKGELADRAETPQEPIAEKKLAVSAAAAPAAARNAAVEQQTTTSPISGKRYGFADVRLTPWKEVPREVKIRILKDELASGADPKEVARVAREAGLDDFADSIEKKH